MRCNKCNHKIPNDSEFCPFCGGAIEKGELCQNCGKVLPLESAFCPYCGASTKQSNTCSKCGQVLPDESAFCPYCGQATSSKASKTNPSDALPTSKTSARQGHRKTVLIAAITIIGIAAAIVTTWLLRQQNNENRKSASIDNTAQSETNTLVLPENSVFGATLDFDITSVTPVYAVPKGNSAKEADSFICACKISTGDTIWANISKLYFILYLDYSESDISILNKEISPVDLRASGWVGNPDSLIPDLSNNIKTNKILNVTDMSEN